MVPRHAVVVAVLIAVATVTSAAAQTRVELVVETSAGMVFLAREAAPDGMAVLATGRKNSRVGLGLYDLKTCLRDAREALSPENVDVQSSEEA